MKRRLGHACVSFLPQAAAREPSSTEKEGKSSHRQNGNLQGNAWALLTHGATLPRDDDASHAAQCLAERGSASKQQPSVAAAHVVRLVPCRAQACLRFRPCLPHVTDAGG